MVQCQAARWDDLPWANHSGILLVSLPTEQGQLHQLRHAARMPIHTNGRRKRELTFYLRHCVGESFQRSGQQDHVANTRKITSVLNDTTPAHEAFIVVTPNVTRRPAAGLFAYDSKRGHQRALSSYVSLAFGFAVVNSASDPVSLIYRKVLCGVWPPHR